MKSIIIDGIEYVPKEKDIEPIIFKQTLHFEVYSEDLEACTWNDAITECSKLGDGWRLPTILELQLMHQNKKLISNLKNDSYWSSTENFANYAWYFVFYNGNTYYSLKNDTYYVRAVRSITL